MCKIIYLRHLAIVSHRLILLYSMDRDVRAVMHRIIRVTAMPTVMSLNIPIRQKLGLVGLFAVGSVALVTGAVRLAVVYPTLKTNDPSYAFSTGTIWL